MALRTVFKQRWLWALIALTILSLIIWFAGPYVAFADHQPFASVIGRLVAILVLVVIWALWLQLSMLRSQRSQRAFAGAVAAQSDAPAVAGGAHGESADARSLRERFAEAMETLGKSGRGGSGLYDLPWYVIIGPPGSGKTTALINSGLHFPLSQKFGAGALRGVGGTRNCDWWFTDEAVLIDTAGRYTTQDSDAIADGAAWAEFLRLLRRYRRRRPINGVLVAISASDLMLLDERGRAEHVAAVRRRLEELNRELHIRLPAYLLITKCDLVAGFIEFFDDLPREGRAQVWGTTFPIEQSERGGVAGAFDAEFDALLLRLNARLLPRVESERDPKRRAAILAFPQQFAALKGPLQGFLGEAFSQTSYDTPVLLRGVYFTSGTQESTPIDRMMGAIARSFGLEERLVAAPAAGGRSYFIERLLKEVVVGEAGLAGLNRRLEVKLRLLHYAGYAGCALLLLLGTLLLLHSDRANRRYLDEVMASEQEYEQTPAPPGPVSGAGIADLLPRLAALRNVVDTADRYQEHRPLGMRWGLYQGNGVSEAAHDAYLRTLAASVLPALAEQLRADLANAASDPERAYETLKAYLMLGDPRRLDPQQLSFMAAVQWRRLLPQPNQAEVRDELQQHLDALLSDPSHVRAFDIDADLVARVRDALKQASVPALMYGRLKLAYAADHKRDWHPDVILGADKVFVRKSGAPLGDPVPALYTKAVFDEYQRTGKVGLLRQFADDRWVFGDAMPSLEGMAGVTQQVSDLYEADYIRAWDALLADVRVRGTTGGPDLSNLLLLLSSPASPLKAFYQGVDKQTNLLAKEDNPALAKADAAAGALSSKASQLSQMFGSDSGSPADQPGAKVTQHFESYHKLVDASGGAAPIDQLTTALGKAQQQLDRANQGGGGTVGDLANAGQSDAFRDLQAQATLLPPALADMLGQLGERSSGLVKDQAKDELTRRYEEQVLRACRQVVQGRYPFDPASTADVPLADFGRVFGYGGVYDSFFKDTLQPLVDTASTPWRWREGAGAATSIPGILERFQAAAAIRDAFFKAGSQQSEVHFTLTPDYLDASVTRFVLELDGQNFEYSHGPARPTVMNWPGNPPGEAVITFEGGGGPGQNLPFEGPWAWFRLLGRAQLQPASDVHYRVTFLVGGRSARLLLDASTIYNPFAHPDVLRFRCG